MVVRLSRGAFAPEKAAEVRGLLHYYVAIDEQASTMINVSVWSGLEEAKQMDTLAPMLAQRAVFEPLGVRFNLIRNYPALWTITP